VERALPGIGSIVVVVDAYFSKHAFVVSSAAIIRDKFDRNQGYLACRRKTVDSLLNCIVLAHCDCS
jgi:hypothetical protein